MLRFGHDGKFILLQVSDPQDLHNARRTMIRMLNRAYDKVNPDLVIFTGDNILGNHLCDSVIGTHRVINTKDGEYRRLKKSLDNILKPVTERHIPFTFIYGNHDDMNSFTKEDQNEIYLSYPLVYGPENRAEGMEAGTFNVPIMSHDGKKVAFNLWCFDSARRLPDGTGLEAVTKECLDWYKQKSAELKENNGGKPVPSLIFQHIPMQEQKDLIDGCEPYSVGAKKFGGEFLRINPKLAEGVLGEPVSAVEKDFGEAEAIKECGDVLAVVTGHDHANQFDGTANGIRHIQTAGCSFRCYGTRDRGVRVFVIDENEPEKFETYTLNYADLCGTGLKAELDYIWDADGEKYKKAALIAGAALICAGTGAAVSKIMKKRK